MYQSKRRSALHSKNSLEIIIMNATDNPNAMDDLARLVIILMTDSDDVVRIKFVGRPIYFEIVIDVAKPVFPATLWLRLLI